MKKTTPDSMFMVPGPEIAYNPQKTGVNEKMCSGTSMFHKRKKKKKNIDVSTFSGGTQGSELKAGWSSAKVILRSF